MSDNKFRRVRNSIKIDGKLETPDTEEVTVLLRDPDANVLMASGATVPTDAEVGYGAGCIFFDIDGGVGATFYVNEGDEASCDFNISGGSTGDITAVTAGAGLTGGGATGAVTLDIVNTDGKITVGADTVDITADSLVDADINSAAAIVLSKLESVADARLIVGSAGNVPTAVDITGDLAIDNAGVTAVSNLTISGEANGDVLYFTGGVWTSLPATSLPAGTASVLAQSTTIEAGANDVVMSTTSQTVGSPTLTIPDFANVDDIFVFDVLQATLENKILKDDSVYFGDSADVTKILEVELAGATTGKTMTLVSSQTDDRSITLPDVTDTLVGKATTDVLTNKTLTSPVLDTGITGTAFLDEDDLASDSATKLASQQSIKAYVDSGTVTFTNKSIDADGTGNVITNINGDELDPIAATNGTYGVPIVIPIVNVGSADIDVFTGNVPFKCRVIDAWGINTQAGNAGNWKLTDGASDVSETVPYGASDNALTRADAILDANHDLDADDLHLINSNAADLSIVYVTVIRIA